MALCIQSLEILEADFLGQMIHFKLNLLPIL